MAINNYLLEAKLFHKRFFPAENAFTYTVYYLCFPLRQLADLANRIFSLNHFNLFSYYEKDHGKKDGSSNSEWIAEVLTRYDITQADGEVVLVTLPRLLGYVFNPVSFWFCLNKNGNVIAVLSEVNNTFGESHNYLVFHDDKRPILPDDTITGKKIFHVSPFMEVSGEYHYRFAYSERRIAIWIDYYDKGRKMLATSVIGKRVDFSPHSLLYYFFRYPLVTLKVIGLIHYQAIKIIAKHITYRKKPQPPKEGISR